MADSRESDLAPPNFFRAPGFRTVLGKPDAELTMIIRKSKV